MTDTTTRLARLGDRYRQRPLLRGLIQLIPFGIGSAMDTAVVTKLATYQEERLRTFFDELEAGNIELTPEVAESEDFIHSFQATTKAVLQTRRREKIRVFGRLLRAAFQGSAIKTVDEYEELLAILDDLSYRELQILALLAKHEKLPAFLETENDLQRANKVWPGFESAVKERLGLEPEDLAPILVRLQRSGCYAEITGSYWDYDGGRGHLTALFKRLERAIGTLDELAA